MADLSQPPMEVAEACETRGAGVVENTRIAFPNSKELTSTLVTDINGTLVQEILDSLPEDNVRMNVDETPHFAWAWYPEGTNLLVNLALGGIGSTAEVFVMDGDGSNIRQLTDNDNDLDTLVGWSPNGLCLALQVDRDDDQLLDSLVVMNADGTKLRELVIY